MKCDHKSTHLSVQGIRDHRGVHFFLGLRVVPCLRGTLAIRDDPAAQGNPSLPATRSPLGKQTERQCCRVCQKILNGSKCDDKEPHKLTFSSWNPWDSFSSSWSQRSRGSSWSWCSRGAWLSRGSLHPSRPREPWVSSVSFAARET